MSDLGLHLLFVGASASGSGLLALTKARGGNPLLLISALILGAIAFGAIWLDLITQARGPFDQKILTLMILGPLAAGTLTFSLISNTELRPLTRWLVGTIAIYVSIWVFGMLSLAFNWVTF